MRHCLAPVVAMTLAVGCGTDHSTEPPPPDGGGGGGATTVIMVATGGNHTCGLTTAGAAYCWGANNYGQLGDGSTADRVNPTAVHGSLSFTTLATSGGSTCGLIASGAAFCWGDNFYDQLGAGSSTGPEYCGGGTTNSCSTTPIAVLGNHRFAALSAFGDHTCGLTNTGDVYCWGVSDLGQLGYGSVLRSATPVLVSGGLTFVALANGGSNHTCGLTNAGVGYCWGFNGFGELGTGSNTGPESCNAGSPTNNPCSTTPVAVTGASNLGVLGVGIYYTCALANGGEAYCWGHNVAGQLGDGLTADSPTPVAVSGGLRFTVLRVGVLHSCGITSSGATDCWGDNSFGQLGTGSATGPDVCNSHPCSLAPTQVVGGLSFSMISPGFDHTCGITAAGVVYCWGDNSHGQIGDATNTQRLVPTRVVFQ